MGADVAYAPASGATGGSSCCASGEVTGRAGDGGLLWLGPKHQIDFDTNA